MYFILYYGIFNNWTSFVVNIVGGSIHTIRKNTEDLVIAGKEIGLEVNAEKIICAYLTIRMLEK
jgi:hypothetical protein